MADYIKLKEGFQSILEVFFGSEVEPKKGDVYQSKTERQEWRSRHAFALLEIDQKFGIFKGVTKAVDLLASPGTWTQVLSRKLRMREEIKVNEKCFLFYEEFAEQLKKEGNEAPKYNENEAVKLVAVDNRWIPPYPGNVQLCIDLVSQDVIDRISEKFDGEKVDLIVSGKLIEFSNMQCIDVIYQTGILAVETCIACNILEIGGTMVVAILKEIDIEVVKQQLILIFKNVDIYTPKSSKISAKGTFVVCRQYCPPKGFNPKLMLPYLELKNKDFSNLSGINRILIPFIIQGDTSAYPVSKRLLKKLNDNTLHCERQFRLEDQKKIHVKEIEAAKRVAMKTSHRDLGATTTKTGPGKEVQTTSSNSPEIDPLTDNPFSELIKQSTKVREYPSNDSFVFESDEERFQFLYDSAEECEALKEYIEQIEADIACSTCICYEFVIE